MNTKHKKTKLNSYESSRKVFSDLKIIPTLGQIIRSLRETDEISQVELATKIGVSRQFLSDVEHDRKSVGVEFAKKLAKATGYPIEAFLRPMFNSDLKRAGIACYVEVISLVS